MSPTVPPGWCQLHRATVADIPSAAEVIAAAFDSLEASSWLVPDRARRRSVLADVFAITVAHAIDFGTVHLLTDQDRSGNRILAAAVWLEQTPHVPSPPDYERRLQVAAGRDTPRFRRLDKLFARHHPTHPHHHLALLGVHPDDQNRGYGATLLRHHLDLLDRVGVPAYLEAAGTRSAPLYTRHGFALSDQPFHLPNQASFHPMWRPPLGHDVEPIADQSAERRTDGARSEGDR